MPHRFENVCKNIECPKIHPIQQNKHTILENSNNTSIIYNTASITTLANPTDAYTIAHTPIKNNAINKNCMNIKKQNKTTLKNPVNSKTVINIINHIHIHVTYMLVYKCFV